MNLSTIECWEFRIPRQMITLSIRRRSHDGTPQFSPGQNFSFVRLTRTDIPAAQSKPVITALQVEEEARDGNILSKKRGIVAAHLPKLWTNDSPHKGLSRPVG